MDKNKSMSKLERMIGWMINDDKILQIMWMWDESCLFNPVPVIKKKTQGNNATRTIIILTPHWFRTLHIFFTYSHQEEHISFCWQPSLIIERTVQFFLAIPYQTWERNVNRYIQCKKHDGRRTLIKRHSFAVSDYSLHKLLCTDLASNIWLIDWLIDWFSFI